MVVGRFPVMAVQYLGIAVKKAQLVVVNPTRTPCVYAARACFGTIVLKVPLHPVAPCFLDQEETGVCIGHDLSLGIFLLNEVPEAVIAIGGNLELLFPAGGGVRREDGGDASPRVILHPQAASRTVGYLLQMPPVVVSEQDFKAIAVADTAQ